MEVFSYVADEEYTTATLDWRTTRTCTEICCKHEEVCNKDSKDALPNKNMEHSAKAWNNECAQERIQIKHEGRHRIHVSASSTETVNRKLLCDTQNPHTQSHAFIRGTPNRQVICRLIN